MTDYQDIRNRYVETKKYIESHGLGWSHERAVKDTAYIMDIPIRDVETALATNDELKGATK